MAQTLVHNSAVQTVTPVTVPTCDFDDEIIRNLDDEPNDVGGLTAAELKEQFDLAGTSIKTYLNEELIPTIIADDLTEQARAEAEAERVANEQERVANEELRVQHEETRVGNEAQRVLNEQGRVNAETARVNETNGVVAQARTQAENSEAYAVGTRGGVPVGPGDPAYENNAKYYTQGTEKIMHAFDIVGGKLCVVWKTEI